MKLINVKVIPQAKKENVFAEGDCLKVHVKSPAVEGRANEAMLKLLADFFKVKKSKVRIVRGERAREKVVEFF